MDDRFDGTMPASGAEPPEVTVRLDHWEPDNLRYICGVANAGGGTLIIRNNDRSMGSGFRKMKRPFERIPQLIERELGINCTTEPILDGSALCLEVRVPAVDGPLALNGTYWLYENGQLEQVSLEDLTPPAPQAAPDTPSAPPDVERPWEAQEQPFARTNDLNASAVMAMTAIAAAEPDDPADSLDSLMDRRLNYLNLVNPQTNAITNAGVLLLHSTPERFIPGASVRLALFDDATGAIVRQDEVRGPLTTQLNRTLQLLFDEYFPENRQAHPATAKAEPPREAVREVLLNALVHKDYASGVDVRVALYSDRLVIQNAISDAQRASLGATGATAPRPHNPIVANALRIMGFMAGWGDSLSRIGRLCADAGCEAPIARQADGEWAVTFPLSGVSAVNPFGKHGRMPAAAPAAAPDAVGSAGNATVPNAMAPDATAQDAPTAPRDDIPVEAAQEKASGPQQRNIASLSTPAPKNAPFTVRSIAAANQLNLTATDEFVLRVLYTNGRATAPRIAAFLGVSESTVRRSFRKLRQHGFIERIGSDKAGYWRVLVAEESIGE